MPMVLFKMRKPRTHGLHIIFDRKKLAVWIINNTRELKVIAVAGHPLLEIGPGEDWTLKVSDEILEVKP